MGPRAFISVCACLDAEDMLARIISRRHTCDVILVGELVHGTMCMHIRVCVLACRRHIRNGILVGELVHGTMCMHIRVCVCLCAADIFATVLWLENWSTGPRACMSPACKHSHTDMHARGPMDEFSNKNHFASMQASTHGYACTWSHGQTLQQESPRKYVLRDKNHIANMSFACMQA